ALPWRCRDMRLARYAITIGARIFSSWPAWPPCSPVAWATPASARACRPPKMWPRMPAPSVCRFCAPPSTAPSTLPRSPPAWSFWSAPSSAWAPSGWLALRPSAPISSGSAALMAEDAWVESMPSCRATCSTGAPCSCEARSWVSVAMPALPVGEGRPSYAGQCPAASSRRRPVEAVAPVLDVALLEAAFEQLAPRGHQRQLQRRLQRLAHQHALEQQRTEPAQRPVRPGACIQAQDVAGFRVARLQHAVVPAGAAGGLHAPRHVGYAEAVVELPARLPALADFQQHGAEAEAVAQADAALVEPAGADVLAERARRTQQRRVPDVLAPGRVVVEGVVVDGLVGAAVDARIALFVAFQAEFADRHRAGERMLVDRAAAAGAGVRLRAAREQHVDADVGERGHVSALSRYRASSACLGVSSSGSMPASASTAAELGANRPICRGASSASADSGGAASRMCRSSSASRLRACAITAFGSPASAATCRPKLRSAGPSLTACMNTSDSLPSCARC